MKAEWVGGPKDGKIEELLGTEPVVVIAGTYDIPERRRVTPRRSGRKWLLDFYGGEILTSEDDA